jgi:hypothetical protein
MPAWVAGLGKNPAADKEPKRQNYKNEGFRQPKGAKHCAREYSASRGERTLEVEHTYTLSRALFG